MAKSPEIYLLRHGETAWSLSGQHTGRTDLPLTPHGEQSAAQLREELRDLRFDQVLTSPSQRARRTCELAGLGDTARVDPDLVEWDYGDYEGRTTADIRTQQPEWDVFVDGCPQGESVAQISQRADRVVAQLRRLEGTTAVFSHGQFLRSLAVRWVGLPVAEGRHFALDTASISVLSYEHESTPAISLWNAARI